MESLSNNINEDNTLTNTNLTILRPKFLVQKHNKEKGINMKYILIDSREDKSYKIKIRYGRTKLLLYKM